MLRRRPRAVPDEISRACTALLGREMSRREEREAVEQLRSGSTVGAVLMQVAQSPEYVQGYAADLAGRGPADADAYVAFLYEEVFQRRCDDSGRAYFGDMLRGGEPRNAVAERLVGADEHINRIVRELYPLPDLRELAPERYRDVAMDDGSGKAVCFVVEREADFTWIEEQILSNDYYDRPGIWGSTVDDDKRRVASLLADLEPKRLLDVGCANGAVIHCLLERGIDAYGVELSASAVERALPDVRDRIHVGDIAALDLSDRFDVIAGLDIFEHVPPAKVSSIIEALRRHLTPGGLIFANIPAFGDDPIFGTVFETYLDDWRVCERESVPFTLLHTDEFGFPLHGHITWADTVWWQQQFTGNGFTRRPDLERAAHAKYGDDFRRETPARGAFYLFEST